MSVLVIRNRFLSALSLGTLAIAIKNTAYARILINTLIINNSYTVFFNFTGLSLTTAHALIPYVGIPSRDIITK